MTHGAPHEKLSAWLPSSEADDLRRLAESQDRSVSAEIRRAIKAHLDANTTKAEAAA